MRWWSHHSTGCQSICGPIALPALGENLNRARQRARAVKCALWSTHYFNAINVIGGEIGEIHQACQSLVDGYAIEKHLGVLAAQAARENRSELAGRPALHNGKAGDFTQRIGDALDLFFFEVLRSHDTDAGGRLDERNVNPCSGDDDWL